MKSKGGSDVGPRVRFAAATCLVASGLLVGGVGGALALADPPSDPAKSQDDGAPAPRDQKPDDAKPGDPKPGEPKPDDPKPIGDDAGDDRGSTSTPDPTRTTDPPTPTKEPEPGQCAKKGDRDCGLGFPWWPFPWPWDPSDPSDPGEPGDPAPGGGGNGNGVPAARPHGRQDLPQMRLPGELLPRTEPAEPAEPFGATPGVGVELPLEPIAMPVVVAPPPALGPVLRTAPVEQAPGSPRAVAEPPVGRQPTPADLGSNVSIPPASYRVGYTDYLRNAGISQVVAMAGPGLAGIFVLTGAGGLLGYRQAKAGHAVRASGTARFVN